MTGQTPQKLIATERVFPTEMTSAANGKIVIEPLKTAWIVFHIMAGLAGIILFPQWNAFAVFMVLSAVTICAGHSVGMHRLLIHRSFKTTRPLEYLLVWLGTLVGMAGPFGMIKAHDMRDWHQRQIHCPPHPSHGAGFWHDAWWQLCCQFRLETPPDFTIEKEVADDPVYRWMERTWMLQQVPLAFLLFAWGGIVFVLWGISLRIAVSLIGHWAIGHFAHRHGHQGWLIAGLPVQGYNLPKWALITFGESWHGNHHAFPHSARLGVERGQLDIGFLLIVALEKVRLVWDVQLPESRPIRAGLRRVRPQSIPQITSAKGSKQI